MENSPLRLGHRGHRCTDWGETENTLAAFDRALACGCDGLELDLRHTLDGQVVIHHDDSLRFRGQMLQVSAHALASLRRLHPGLATLEQALRRYRDYAWCDFELKTLEAAAPAVELLRRHAPRRGFVVSCFEPPILRRVAELGPELPLCLNLKRPCSLRRLRAAEVSWVAPNEASCTAWYVRWLRAHGWKVLIWTVNRPARMRLLARAGADAIVSDLPEVLVAVLSEQNRATCVPSAASACGDEKRSGGSSSPN
ncbi:MAG: glycerophosphodiester phosphodiesterase [Terriglobales bacterium]